jgi:hypothetical protein
VAWPPRRNLSWCAGWHPTIFAPVAEFSAVVRWCHSGCHVDASAAFANGLVSRPLAHTAMCCGIYQNNMIQRGRL